jgi:hypothetical protein
MEQASSCQRRGPRRQQRSGEDDASAGVLGTGNEITIERARAGQAASYIAMTSNCSGPFTSQQDRRSSESPGAGPGHRGSGSRPSHAGTGVSLSHHASYGLARRPPIPRRLASPRSTCDASTARGIGRSKAGAGVVHVTPLEQSPTRGPRIYASARPPARITTPQPVADALLACHRNTYPAPALARPVASRPARVPPTQVLSTHGTAGGPARTPRV